MSDYLSGQLSGPAFAQVEAHLGQCAACSVELGRLDAADSLLRLKCRERPPADLLDNLWPKIQARLPESPAEPGWLLRACRSRWHAVARHPVAAALVAALIIAAAAAHMHMRQRREAAGEIATLEAAMARQGDAVASLRRELAAARAPRQRPAHQLAAESVPQLRERLEKALQVEELAALDNGLVEMRGALAWLEQKMDQDRFAICARRAEVLLLEGRKLRGELRADATLPVERKPGRRPLPKRAGPWLCCPKLRAANRARLAKLAERNEARWRKACDTDGDGAVTPQELARARLLARDLNSDGTVDATDRESARERWRKACDRDGDGTVTPAERRRWLLARCDLDGNGIVNDGDWKMVELRGRDLNKDGKVDASDDAVRRLRCDFDANNCLSPEELRCFGLRTRIDQLASGVGELEFLVCVSHLELLAPTCPEDRE